MACMLAATDNAAIVNTQAMFLQERLFLDIFFIILLLRQLFLRRLYFVWSDRNSFVRSTIHEATSSVALGRMPSLL